MTGVTGKTRELKVIFDTNAVYSRSEQYLLQHEVSDLIRDSVRHEGIDLTWVLPEIVRHERQAQMFKSVSTVFPQLAKLERILGAELGIAEEDIQRRIAAGIEQQAADLGLQIVGLDPGEVDWNHLMSDSVYRRPPFDPGEKEKGFRDALVVETVIQVVQATSASAPNCIVAFVCGDKLLKEAVAGRTAGAENVRILDGLEEVKSLINTLVSEAGEELVRTLTPLARAFFHQIANKESLYFRADISSQIKQDFADERAALPPDTDSRENSTYLIQEPTFLRKEEQRVYWVSRMRVMAMAYTTLDPQVFTLEQSIIGPESEQVGSSVGFRQKATPEGNKQVLVAKGESIFDISWSVTVGPLNSLSDPQIEAIQFVETRW